MEEKEQRYNGWTNYETWAVALWLDNDENNCIYWASVADQCKAKATEAEQVAAGTWTVYESARFSLAEQLKEDIESRSPLEEASLYSDLLNSAIQSVNWDEIASAQLDED